MLLVKYCSKVKKISLVFGNRQGEIFLSLAARIVKCVSEYTFLFEDISNKQTNKQTKQESKKAKKKTTKEAKRIYPENRLKQKNCVHPGEDSSHHPHFRKQ